MLPANFKTLYSDEQIANAVKRIGTEINVWAENIWKQSHTDLLTIPVLRGGIFFFADLVRQIQASVELAPARAIAYVDGQNEAQTTQVKINIDGVPAKGRSVLLVDEICDSGRTLKILSQTLLGAGAVEVKSAVLVKRIIDKETFNPDWVGFEYRGPEWLVGYGMDDNNRWRNLSSIYIIRQS